MVERPSSRPGLSAATVAGLFLALVVPVLPPLVYPIFFGAQQTGARVSSGIIEHWINFAGLIAIVIFAERQGLASIGLRPLRWWTLPLGVLAGVVIVGLSGVIVGVLRASPDKSFVAFLQSLPFVTRLLLVVTAGVFEETLYRGYAFERLAGLLNSPWAAAAVTVAFFTAAHIPAVGLAHLAPVFIVSVFVTLLYLWRRDLTVNIIAHATIDGVGLLLGPMLPHGGA